MSHKYERWKEIYPGSGNYYIWHFDTEAEALLAVGWWGGEVRLAKVEENC